MLSHQVKSHQGTGIVEFTFPKFCVDVIPGTIEEPVCDVRSLVNSLLHRITEKILVPMPLEAWKNPCSLSKGPLIAMQ